MCDVVLLNLLKVHVIKDSNKLCRDNEHIFIKFHPVLSFEVANVDDFLFLVE